MPFKKFRRWCRLQKLYLKEVFHFWLLTVKYNATNHTDRDIQKMQYTLSREAHTIEKGLSIKIPKKGFGKQKVTSLISRLHLYYEQYQHIDSAFLEYPLATIQSYIDFMKKQKEDISSIEIEFKKLLKMLKKEKILANAGTYEESKKNILGACKGNFKELVSSRHSIRYFSSEPVSQDDVKEALKIAQKTPSACNRQAWATHVFFAPQSIELIKWQGGSRGFEDEIKCAILVTANLKAFLSHEIHQAYIDGGLYAMNLINALHYLGLATIPLSCGFLHEQLKDLSKFSIPENEVPILIIGIGHMQDYFKVAVSERKDVERTNTFHESN